MGQDFRIDLPPDRTVSAWRILAYSLTAHAVFAVVRFALGGVAAVLLAQAGMDRLGFQLLILPLSVLASVVVGWSCLRRGLIGWAAVLVAGACIGFVMGGLFPAMVLVGIGSPPVEVVAGTMIFGGLGALSGLPVAAMMLTMARTDHPWMSESQARIVLPGRLFVFLCFVPWTAAYLASLAVDG